MLINTSADDLNSKLKCCRGKYSIAELNRNIIAEYERYDCRVSVIRMLQREIKLLWKKAAGKVLFENYPKLEVGPKEHRRYYVRYPVLMPDGKYYAVDVCLPSGYNKIAGAIGYAYEENCMQACDVENKLGGFTKAQVLEILGESFKNAE